MYFVGSHVAGTSPSTGTLVGSGDGQSQPCSKHPRVDAGVVETGESFCGHEGDIHIKEDLALSKRQFLAIPLIFSLNIMND